VGFCEHGHEASGFIHGDEFLEYYLLKEDSAPRNALVTFRQ